MTRWELFLRAYDYVAVIGWAVGTVGLMLSAFNLVDAIKDRTYVRDLGINGRRALVANSNVSQELTRMIGIAILVVIEIVSLLMPDVPLAMGHEALLLLFARRVFVLAVTIVLMVGGYADRRFRHDLRKVLRAKPGATAAEED